MARSKAKKAKYYVAQTGGTTTNTPIDNTVDYQHVPLGQYATAPSLAQTAGPAAAISAPAPTNGSNPGVQFRRNRPNWGQVGLTSFNNAATTVTGLADMLTNNKENRRSQELWLKTGQRFNDAQPGPVNTRPAYTKAGGKAPKYGFTWSSNNAAVEFQAGGQLPDNYQPEDDGEAGNFSGDEILDLLKAGGWIKGAINPKHKGYCTPMTKSTCTPRRKALARTFKKHHGFHKSKLGGDTSEWDDIGPWSTYDDEDELEKAATGMTVAPTAPFAPGFRRAANWVSKNQTGGTAFGAGEDAVAAQYTKLGYTVTKDPATGKMKFTKNGITADPRTAANTTANVAASQAASGNTQAPVKSSTPQQTSSQRPKGALPLPDYSDPQSRMNFAQQWAKKYNIESGYGDIPLRVNERPYRGQDTSKGMAMKAAQQTGLDPALIYSSSMVEGMSGLYPNKEGKVRYGDDPDYPIQGAALGLNNFSSRVPELIKKGYLPQDFANRYKKYTPTDDELKANPNVTTDGAVFKTPDDAMMAHAARLRADYDEIDQYSKKNKINLSPQARDFFALANFNSGLGNQMMNKYNKNGYLKNDSFLKANPDGSYPEVYNHVMTRIKERNALMNEGQFDSNNQTVQSNTAQQQGTMKAGGKNKKAKTGGAFVPKGKNLPNMGSSGSASVEDCGCDADQPDLFQFGGALPVGDGTQQNNSVNYDTMKYILNKMAFGGALPGDYSNPNFAINNDVMKAGGHWIQGAIKHPGRCSNPGDARCPKGSPQYNLAMTFKKHHGFHKGQAGGDLQVEEGGCEDCDEMVNEQFQAGGKRTVTRKSDYGSKSHPYPSVAKGDFAGGHRSYPIPTKENARKALYLAHIHHRPDVIAKVHKKYPGLTSRQVGGGVNNNWQMIPKKAQFGAVGGTGREDLDVDDMMQFAAGGWIKGAINPSHKGWCTPLSNPHCTGHRRALALRFKHGDLHKGQAGGDLYNDVPQYEIDNNYLMQAGGGIPEVEGLQGGDQQMANVEAERGEVYRDKAGNLNQVDTDGATHEQGGEKLPGVARVLENTSNLRKDKVSKYLKLSPDAIKALTGLDTNKSMSHAEALVKGSENLEKQKQRIVDSMELSTKYRKGIGLDNYAENSAKLNLDHFRAMPTQDELFNRLFDHQEMTKSAMGINNDGTQTAKFGGKYMLKAQTGIQAYPGNQTGQTTPAGNSDAFPDNRQLADYLQELKSNGVKFDNIHSNADLQNAVYSYALKNNPDAIRSMWKEGIQNFGMDKAIKAGFVYDKDDANTGAKRGEFKPGVLDDPKNLDKLQQLYPDNLLGRRIIDIAKAKGPKVWTDSDIPPQPGAPASPDVTNPKGTIDANFRLRNQPQSQFNEPLRWYDTASAVGTYLSAQRRLAEPYAAPHYNQVGLKLLDPTAALASNQEDFNAALQTVQNASPFDVGLQMANIANLTGRKYALNNQVMGNYENQNAAIKNQEIEYNAKTKDMQSASDANARTAYANRVLESKAKQQETKLTALDSLYKTVAENSALNRNGNLIMKLSRAFDQYGNYNGYAPSFRNPVVANNNGPQAPVAGGSPAAGGIQGLTPGKTYYNRKTGKTLRYDGTNLVEIK